MKNLFEASVLLPKQLAAIRLDPNRFIESTFVDAIGSRVTQCLLHQELQDALSSHAQVLVELPRDHGKTSQVCMRILWELGNRPHLRIQLVCATEAIAVNRGRFIRSQIETNPFLGTVFPNLKPGRPWSDTCFTVQRDCNPIGPSVSACGVGGGTTGNRADLLICDDIVDVRSIHSKSERERVKVYFRENLMNLLEPDGRFWGLFTPWHRDDLNHELKKNPAYHLFRRAINDQLDPIWPEKWSRERLEKRKQEVGSVSFNRAYHLLAISEEEAIFRRDWIHFWFTPQRYEQVLLAIDPALSINPQADATALVVLGRTAENEIDCLAASSVRIRMTDLIHHLGLWDQLYHPQVILFESNAAFAGIRDLFARHSLFGPKIKGIVQTKDKATRMRAFSVPVENGFFRLKGKGEDRGTGGEVSADQQALWEEMILFPHADHDDLVDAAAMGTMFLLGQTDPRVFLL